LGKKSRKKETSFSMVPPGSDIRVEERGNIAPIWKKKGKRNKHATGERGPSYARKGFGVKF